jgi:hypothetical protein
VWSRLLGLIGEIEATGLIPRGETAAVADGFELRGTSEDADLGRLLRAVSEAHGFSKRE